MDLQLQPGTASDARQALKRAATASICHTCFAEIPAVVEERDDGALYIVKTCRAHGVSEAMAERDAGFCREAMRHKGLTARAAAAGFGSFFGPGARVCLRLRQTGANMQQKRVRRMRRLLATAAAILATVGSSDAPA